MENQSVTIKPEHQETDESSRENVPNNAAQTVSKKVSIRLVQVPTFSSNKNFGRITAIIRAVMVGVFADLNIRNLRFSQMAGQ